MFSILHLNKNKLKNKITDVSLGHYSNRNHQRNSQPEIDHWRVTAPFFSLSKLSQTNISFVRLAFSISEIGPYPSFCKTPAKRVVWTDSNEKLHCIVTNLTWSLFHFVYFQSSSQVLKAFVESSLKRFHYSYTFVHPWFNFGLWIRSGPFKKCGKVITFAICELRLIKAEQRAKCFHFQVQIRHKLISLLFKVLKWSWRSTKKSRSASQTVTQLMKRLVFRFQKLVYFRYQS